MRLVILGLIGAGKGTQAKQVAERHGLLHLSTGDMLREAVSQGTDLGKRANEYMTSGQLVPDELVIDMLLERIAEPDADNGFILDGFPRTVPQAIALDAALDQRGIAIDVVPFIRVDEQVLLDRIAKRAEIEGRADDAPEVAQRRLQEQSAGIEGVAGFYRERGLLCDVDGFGSVDEVNGRLEAELAQVSTSSEKA
jgi:adenylate kinase